MTESEALSSSFLNFYLLIFFFLLLLSSLVLLFNAELTINISPERSRREAEQKRPLGRLCAPKRKSAYLPRNQKWFTYQIRYICARVRGNTNADSPDDFVACDRG